MFEMLHPTVLLKIKTSLWGNKNTGIFQHLTFGRENLLQIYGGPQVHINTEEIIVTLPFQTLPNGTNR